MACRVNRGSAIVLCLGLLVFVTSLCHCTKKTRLKGLDETKRNSEYIQSQVGRSHQHHGRLLIGLNSKKSVKVNGTNSTENVLGIVTDYQADMGWWQTKKPHDYDDWPQTDSAATHRLLESDSKVECTQNSMKLLVQDAVVTPAALIFVDRGNLSPLSLTKLPSSCGYTVRSTASNLVLVAPYDGCFVVIEEDSYVLPLRWWGLPVKMSCPMIEHVSSNPPMITCHAEGMVVQTEWTSSASNVKANVNGNWEPLLTAAQRCAFGIVEHPEGVVISARFAPCLRKKDGLYTFELAADKETRVSCPSLLPADIKSTEDLSIASLQQSEKPSGWMTPFNTPYPSLYPRSGQIGSQIPNFPQSLDLPSKQYKVPKGFDPSFFYSFSHPYSASPKTTPTKPLHTRAPTKPEITGEDFHFPINHLPVFLPMWPPVTKSPPPEHEVDQRLYQFNLSPKLSQKITEPPSSHPKGREQGYPDQFTYTQTSPQTHSYQLYLEKLPEKPGKLHTSVSGKLQPEENLPLHLICNQQIPASKFAGASQGQASQPFYLFCTQLKPALNTASQQPHHKIPQDQEYYTFFFSCTQETQASKPTSQPLYTANGQVYQSFNLLCTLLRRSSQPSGVTWAPQHEALQSYRYRAFFPYYAQSQPTSKPDVTQPPHPRTQGQVYQQFFPFYTQSKPTPKPAKPQQPVTPQGQSFQQFFQFFTQPQPTLKPADITRPPLPNTSPGQVYNHFLDYFYQLKQAHKPAVTPPPNPAVPQGQAYQSLLDYLTQQNQTPKPDIQSLQPETPEDQLYQAFFHLHTPLKQTRKSAVTLPPLPATPRGQAHQHSFHFPAKSKLTSIPTVSEPSDLDISQGLVNQPFFHFQKPELQLTSKPSDPLPESSHSQMYQLLHPYQLHTHPKPLKEPTLVSQPSQPAVLQGEAHQMCLYDQLLTESQLAKMPTEIILGKVYGPCELSWKLGAETSSFLKPAAHVQPAYCSQFCPSGLSTSNCCLQIAFHQHLHISPGQDGKDVSHIYNRQPFSQAVYPDFSRGLEGGQSPQKLSEGAVLRSSKAPMDAHVSPHWLPWDAGQNQEYFQPPDGNPAAQARSSPIQTAKQSPVYPKQSPVYPYFATDSSNPDWEFLPYSDAPNLGQRKSEGFNDPSKLWASGVERPAPVEQRELDAINFPQQHNSQVLAEHTHSRPNFMSYINHHGSYTAEQQSKLDIERSLPNSEFEDSTHNLKHAIDDFFSPHYMPQDAPNSHRNASEALNSQTHLNSNNSTKAEQAMNTDSRQESYELLQHGPPIGFSDSVDLRNLDHSLNSKMQILTGHQISNQNLKLLDGSLFESPEDEVPNPFLDDVDYMLRMDDKVDLPLFSSTLDDTDLVHLPPEQYFSAAQLKPEVLESFEDFWESMTPSDSSQSFAAQVSSKRTSAADQTA